MSFRLVQSGDSQSSTEDEDYTYTPPPAYQDVDVEYDDIDMSMFGACGGGGVGAGGGLGYGVGEASQIYAPRQCNRGPDDETPTEPRGQPAPPTRFPMFVPTIDWTMKIAPNRNLMRTFREERPEIYANDTPVRGTISPFLAHAREGSDSSIEWEGDPLMEQAMRDAGQCRSSSVDRQSVLGFGRSSGSGGVSGSGYSGGISSGSEHGYQQPLRHCTTPIDEAQCGAGSASSSERSWLSDISTPLEMRPIAESPIYQRPFIGAGLEVEEFPLVEGFENFEIEDPEPGYGGGQGGWGACCPGGRCNIL